ncbi:MAG: hypothetical protein IPL90_19255 [Holophagales bacterium]|nr:hypothetical protein [Holophagales bacterium]
MFSRCKIQLTQRSRPGTINPSDVVGITLLKPVVGGSGKNPESQAELFKGLGEGYNFSGTWRPMDKAATIGTGATHDDKTHFWRYSVGRRELEFVEREKWTGTGDYGSFTEQIRQIAILRQAQLTPRGLEPLGALTVGPGELVYDDNYALRRGPISWEYLINYG